MATPISFHHHAMTSLLKRVGVVPADTVDPAGSSRSMAARLMCWMPCWVISRIRRSASAPRDYTLPMPEPLPRTALTLEFSQTEFAALASAAEKAGVTPVEYVRYAALRMAAQDARLPGSEASGTSPSRRSLRPRRFDAKMPTHEIVRQLTTHLGVRLLALTLATDAESIKSWAEEKNPPPEPFERRLRVAHEIWQLVCSVESPNTVRTWWMGMKDGLDDLSPAEAIALDQYDDVRAVARYFVEAG